MRRKNLIEFGKNGKKNAVNFGNLEFAFGTTKFIATDRDAFAAQMNQSDCTHTHTLLTF